MGLLDGEARTAISNGLVALLKEFYGVGPTQAKTYYHDDLVVCLLRGGYTRVEETLLAGGRGIERNSALRFGSVFDRFAAATNAPRTWLMSSIVISATSSAASGVLAASPAIIYTTRASGGYACTFISENQ